MSLSMLAVAAVAMVANATLLGLSGDGIDNNDPGAAAQWHGAVTNRDMVAAFPCLADAGGAEST